MRCAVWPKRRARKRGDIPHQGSSMMKTFTDLAAAYRELGPLRFSLIAGGTLAAIIVFTLAYVALSERVGWPEAYGFSCSRKCAGPVIWHSPKLLENGSAAEVLLFLVIWSIPLSAVAIAVPMLLIRWLKRRRVRTRPML